MVVYPAINVSIPWKFYLSITWSEQRPMAGRSFTSQPMGREQSDSSQGLTSQTSEPARPSAAGESPCDVVRCDRRSVQPTSRTMVKLPSAVRGPSFSGRLFPSSQFRQQPTHLPLAGRTSKLAASSSGARLSIVRQSGIPTSPALTELLSAPNPTPSSDSEQEGHRTKEDSRKHGRLSLLHADNQHSRRMDGSCGNCE